MKVPSLLTILFLLLSTLLLTCDKTDTDNKTIEENYIRIGNTYYPLNDALAVYDNTDPAATHFSLELSGNKNDLAVFDHLIVATTNQLPAGNFNFHQASSSQDFQVQKFNDLHLRYGHTAKTTVDPQGTVILSGALNIKKLEGDRYQINGIIKSNTTEYQVSYTGVVDHMEAW